MNNNTTWTEVFLTLGAGVFFILVIVFLNTFTNPRIEHQCAVKGGQILQTPGHLSSCIYPAK